ncbi:hypothetical protein OS493_000268 [Desmophyllum pertusum]|uniref:Centrosomal protein of 104 kDa n=1 Tax=Desmophyllum pertusum TaxID=174260 RepID=A0A9X0A6W0_9CNID|nr:hypothetical protein OS493_000268 [Desmophyllum pertusum]
MKTQTLRQEKLKSIHLDAEGHFVKLILHKNHVNKYNMYNQVGLVAVNVIGDRLDTPYDPLDPDPLKNVDSLVQGYMNPNSSNGPVWGRINKPDYISRMDDLAFDMYQDPETAALIRKLDDRKREAVQQERYDYAKKLTAVISDLYKVGEKLGRYEVEKKKAVELEDYDLAMEKKRQGDEFRLYVYKQLDIQETTGTRWAPPPLPPIVTDHHRQPPLPRHQEEERRTPPLLSPIRQQLSPREEDTPSVMSPRKDDDVDDRPLPALNKRSPEAEQETVESPRDNSEAAGFVIEVFGEDLVQHAYSKQWKYRQEAMENLERELSSDTAELTSDKDPKTVVKAAVFLIQKGIKDQVFSVFNACLEALRSLVKTYIPRHKIVKSEMSHVAEKTTPPLLAKLGEMAARSRDAATAMIMELAVHKDIKPAGVIADHATRPFKSKHQVAPRMYKSRIEIIEKLLGVLELDSDKPGSLSTGNIMRIVLPALEHTSGDVRDPASRLILELYKKVKDTVRDYLPPDEPATRKNPLYRNLFDGFDKIDGKPTEAERRAQAKAATATSEKAKQAEIAALQAQLQALRDMAGESSKPSNSKPAKEEQVDVDRMCIFCGEKNESFTEEMLDIHYWKSCPMLKRCDHCAQVTEISGVNEHLLTECDSSDKFAQCPRCKEAVLKADLEEHYAANNCSPAKGPRCILCGKTLGKGDEVWSKHLKEDCAPNKARLQQQIVSKAPSQASLRSTRGRGGKTTPLGRGAGKGGRGEEGPCRGDKRTRRGKDENNKSHRDNGN